MSAAGLGKVPRSVVLEPVNVRCGLVFMFFGVFGVLSVVTVK